MPPSVGDNVILESGTIKTDKVAMRDLAFWLPLTKPHLVNGVHFANSFETLVNLPIPQIGYILGVVIKIMRKNRKVNGERLSNCSLINKRCFLIIISYYVNNSTSLLLYI